MVWYKEAGKFFSGAGKFFSGAGEVLTKFGKVVNKAGQQLKEASGSGTTSKNDRMIIESVSKLLTPQQLSQANSPTPIESAAAAPSQPASRPEYQGTGSSITQPIGSVKEFDSSKKSSSAAPDTPIFQPETSATNPIPNTITPYSQIVTRPTSTEVSLTQGDAMPILPPRTSNTNVRVFLYDLKNAMSIIAIIIGGILVPLYRAGVLRIPGHHPMGDQSQGTNDRSNSIHVGPGSGSSSEGRGGGYPSTQVGLPILPIIGQGGSSTLAAIPRSDTIRSSTSSVDEPLAATISSSEDRVVATSPPVSSLTIAGELLPPPIAPSSSSSPALTAPPVGAHGSYASDDSDSDSSLATQPASGQPDYTSCRPPAGDLAPHHEDHGT